MRDPRNGWFYVHGPGVDAPLVAEKRSTGSNVEQARLYPVMDGTGQLLSIADSNGIFNNSFEGPNNYTPGTWATSGITTRAQTFDPRRLATDTNTAMSSFRTRQYDPNTGSWLQEDHAGLAGGVNLYEYNGNDPNSFRDPVGVDPEECPDCTDAGMLSRVTEAEVSANAPTRGPIVAQATHDANAIIGVVAGLEDAAAEGAEEAVAWGSKALGRIVQTGQDVTEPGSVMNRRPGMSTTQLQGALRNEGFSEQPAHPNGATSFTKDITRVTIYRLSSSRPSVPSAEVFVGGESVLKIRLTPEP
jgi:RHS repeat-associated protein